MFEARDLHHMFLRVFFKPFCYSLQKGQGAPAREPVITDDQQKQMMMHYYRKQEELKVRKRVTCYKHLALNKHSNLFFVTFLETGGGGR